jgi:hypothetical protein
MDSDTLLIRELCSKFADNTFVDRQVKFIVNSQILPEE